MSWLNAVLGDKRGDIPILAFVIIFVLLTFSGIMMELYRIHSIQSHVEYELQRAVNIAVEEAMHDTWRQDKYGRLDTARAVDDFYDYLHHDLGLTHALDKIQDGKLVYRLEITDIQPVYDPPRLYIEGNIKLVSAFDFLAGEITVPFRIASRNQRTD